MEPASEIIDKMKRWRDYGELLQKLAESLRKHPSYMYPPPGPHDISLLEWWLDIDCNSCSCEKTESVIREQLEVIQKLNKYTDFTQSFPEATEWANAAGNRSEAYHAAPRCIQKAIDEMESISRTLGPAIELGLLVLWEGGATPKVRKLKRDIEIVRSKQFIELLKALYWYCCGDEAYECLLERLGNLKKDDRDKEKSRQGE